LAIHRGHTCSAVTGLRPQKMQLRPLPSGLMPDTEREPTQPTQPKGIDPKTGEPYEPIEIPVPKRSVFDALLGHAETTPPPKRSHQ
jgi:hypothetical protein